MALFIFPKSTKNIQNKRLQLVGTHLISVDVGYY